MYTDEQKTQFNERAMLIILHAGNAREEISTAFDEVILSNYQKATSLIASAKENINRAHKIQTQEVQKEARGERYYYSMLFSHAQDTLMTVQSEYNIAKKIIPVLKKIEEK